MMYEPCKNPFVRNGFEFPCKICQRKQTIRDLKRRVRYEAHHSETMYFVTLKYKLYEFDYPEIQEWLKRARYYASKRGYKFKYFAVREYGKKFGRMHWHLIIFGPNSMRTRDFRHWKAGHLYLKTASSIAKPSGYVTKTLNYASKDVTNALWKTSTGLGKAGVADIMDHPLVAAVTDNTPATLKRVKFPGDKYPYAVPKNSRSVPEPPTPEDAMQLAIRCARVYSDDPEIISLLPKKAIKLANTTSEPTTL